MCSWRRSLKIFGQVSKVMDHVEQNHDYKYIFLTLTVKNCSGDKLKDTLDLMMGSFSKMSRRKPFKDAVKGYFRSLEVNYDSEKIITHDMYYGNPAKHINSRKSYYDKNNLKIGDNNPNYDLYHPHFHVILAVNKSYFTDNKIYLSQEKWTDLWKSCLKIDYTPIVDVRRFKKNKGKEVAEVAKYSVKSEDFLIRKKDGNIDEQHTDKVIKTLDSALHGKRLVSFGFLFKDIHNKLKLDDAEDGNLIDTDNEEDLRDDLTSCLLVYQWGVGIRNYKLIKVMEDVKE